MSKLCWTKAGRTVHEDGGTTVTYKAEGSPNLCLLNHNKVQSDDWYCADGECKGGDE